jgi:hypothetical protein
MTGAWGGLVAENGIWLGPSALFAVHALQSPLRRNRLVSRLAQPYIGAIGERTPHCNQESER